MGKRILVFDDKPENLRVAQQAYDKLVKYGYSVETTSSPDEALDKIERGEADILVTDLYAPREMVSPRILDRWKGLTTEAAEKLKRLKKEGRGGYALLHSDKSPFKAKTKRELNSSVNYLFQHPDWEADVRVPYDEVASLRRLMLMEPSRNALKAADMVGSGYKLPSFKGYSDENGFNNFWQTYISQRENMGKPIGEIGKPIEKIRKPIGENFTFEEFKQLNPNLDEKKAEYIFQGHKNLLKKTPSGVMSKEVPVGVVLYAAAQEKGIPANIVSDTHRHALQGGTRDIRGVVLPLLVKDPSLVTKDSEVGGYPDQSRIRTNANKQEVSSWYYGGGYERTSASFLPEELKGLSGKTLEEKLEQKGGNEDTGLGKKLTPVIATIGLLSGIFFLSNNLTGNVIANSGSIPIVGNAIANLSTQNISLIGVGLVVIGLIAGFFWIKKKKKK